MTKQEQILKQSLQKDLKKLSYACFEVEVKLEIGNYFRQRLYRLRYEIEQIQNELKNSDL